MKQLKSFIQQKHKQNCHLDTHGVTDKMRQEDKLII